jgi:hypothetical protein
MKGILAALCTVALLLVGCSEADIVGSGNIISKDRTAVPFHGIDQRSPCTVIITYGQQPSIRVEADDNVVDRVKTTIVNGVLFIEASNGPSTIFRGAKVYLTTNDLRTVFSTGTGSITIGEGFRSESLTMYNYGAGDMQVKAIETERLTTKIEGMGSITLSGVSKEHNASIFGGGNMNAYELTTERSAVAVYQSGSAYVHASNVLFADIFGSGDIVYKGDPVVYKREDGTGHVRRWI